MFLHELLPEKPQTFLRQPSLINAVFVLESNFQRRVFDVVILGVGVDQVRHNAVTRHGNVDSASEVSTKAADFVTESIQILIITLTTEKRRMIPHDVTYSVIFGLL